jgi:membrane-bound lytic murein transglycosylase F
MIYLKGKFFFFSTLLSVILFSCVMNPPEEKHSFDPKEHKLDLGKILQKGKLVVLAENSSSTYFNYREKEMGFEYEVLNEFAKKLGVALEIKVIDNLDDVFDQLKRGEGDILACNLTITKEREKIISFSAPLMSIPQVLVQRKENTDTIKEAPYISEASQLAKKKVNVWKQSSYYDRLIHLQDEIGDTIFIQGVDGIIGSDELIEEVSEGIIDYTIVEENVAKVNARFFENLDVSVPISAKQKIAFGLRQSSPLLKAELDAWLNEFTRSSVYKYIYHKYFELGQIGFQTEEPAKAGAPKNNSKGKLSDYKAMFEAAGKKYDLNWRWLAAVSYHESRFDPNAVSFGGAYSMMQFMPEIGPTFGVYPDSPPDVQIMGGAKKLRNDIQSWKSIPGDINRIKFALASYNCGQGHVYDAQRLATKYGKDPNKWDNNVEDMILQLSKKEYYGDPVVRHGSMRGTITYKYVREIYAHFLEYCEEYK